MRLTFRRLVITLFSVTTALLCSSSARADTTMYFNDFDGGQITASGVTATLSGITTTESVQDYAGIGSVSNQFGGDFLRNGTGGIPTTGTPGTRTTLTLTNLPAHSSISLGFLLGTIDSWDGVDGLNIATGDYFNVHVDGVEVFEASFAQASGTRGNAYQAPQGAELSFGSDLFGIDFLSDGAYDMSTESALSNIAHTSSTLVVEFFADGPGWQGEQNFSSVGPDESWAIENLRVSLVAIPEPTHVYVWMAAGFGAVLIRRR